VEIVAETRTPWVGNDRRKNRRATMPSQNAASNSSSSTTTVTATSIMSTSLQLQELQVAQQELRSGSQSGRVYVRLSPGAVVAFPLDRSVAQARVERKIQELETKMTTVATTTERKKKDETAAGGGRGSS
jgi:chaperonin cofactor prefoldin